MALLDVLVGALEDGVLLQRGDLLVLLDAAEASLWIVLKPTLENYFLRVTDAPDKCSTALTPLYR